MSAAPRGAPRLLPGAAAAWPATAGWDFEFLSTQVPDRTVLLVEGNREGAATRLVKGRLRDYLAGLALPPNPARPPLYLKEFDLLRAAPALRADLRPRECWPAGGIVASSAWIGPAGTRTGLHCDLLDNVAVVLRGRKRFRWAAPEVVPRHGGVSAKFDRWARIARCSADELVAAGAEVQEAILGPGDALHLPALWWHEVENLAPSILLSGFHGSTGRVLGLWARTGALSLLHHAGLSGHEGCTCHARP